jgi:hypothetical protein
MPKMVGASIRSHFRAGLAAGTMGLLGDVVNRLYQERGIAPFRDKAKVLFRPVENRLDVRRGSG